MQVAAILQARMSSSRLPGKVIKPLCGRPMLERQLERVRRARRLDTVLVATSTDPSDGVIESLCREAGVNCFRGDLTDVLDRYVKAGETLGAEHIVRLTGDCPLADPAIIDAVVEQHLREQADYTSNCAPPTLPDGLDVEVLRWPVLQQAAREARLASEREHVTLFVRNHPQRFRLSNYQYGEDWSGYRLTVDDPEDYVLVSKIYEALYPQKKAFDIVDIMALLREHPGWLDINRHIGRDEGLQRSLAEDKELY